MTVSIITIGLNNEYGYRMTLSSIIKQTCKDYELIVVDEGSTDGSLEIIQSFSSYISHLISEKDRGIYHAMNKGIKCASGKYCLFLNSGDTFHDADVLGRVCDNLSGADFYSGHLQRFNKRKCWINYSPKRVTAYFLAQKALYHPSMVSDFNTEGVSSNAGYQELQNKERSQVLHALFTPLVVDALLGASKFEQRILYALTKEKKWKRDLKMLRNLLKVIPVDFFHYIFGGRK